jgi:hypothetical protein
MWNMGQNETSLYFCMKQVLKLMSGESSQCDLNFTALAEKIDT